jgi:hypothetical protein
MITKRYSDGSMRLHIEDKDDYTVTNDNGVDIYLSKEQVEEIVQFGQGAVLDKMRKRFPNQYKQMIYFAKFLLQELGEQE